MAKIMKARLTQVEFYGLVKLAEKHAEEIKAAPDYMAIAKILGKHMQKEINDDQAKKVCELCGIEPQHKRPHSPISVVLNKIDELRADLEAAMVRETALKLRVEAIERRLDTVCAELGMVKVMGTSVSGK